MAHKQTTRIARQLFAPPKGVMETPEQRHQMATVLGMSDDPRMRRLSLDILANENKQTSVAKLVNGLSLNWKQVESEFRSIKKSEGFIRASQHLPDLMEQSAVDAKSRWEPCWTCERTGVVTDMEAMTRALKEAEKRGEAKDTVDRITKVCGVCHGEKQIYVMGDLDRQKLVFETFGLIGKNGGLNVNLDLRRVDQSEGLEELSQSVAGILDGTGKME